MRLLGVPAGMRFVALPGPTSSSITCSSTRVTESRQISCLEFKELAAHVLNWIWQEENGECLHQLIVTLLYVCQLYPKSVPVSVVPKPVGAANATADFSVEDGQPNPNVSGEAQVIVNFVKYQQHKNLPGGGSHRLGWVYFHEFLRRKESMLLIRKSSGSLFCHCGRQ